MIASWKYGSETVMMNLISFLKHIKFVQWQEPLVQKEWKAITRFLKVFIISMNLIPKAPIICHLGINYPNASDRVLSDSIRPGGDIYIHGNCVTVGCIPLQNDQIEELYILAANAKNQGQDFIPVHIFPIRYNVRKSFDYLARTTKDNQDLQRFAIKIKEVFDYFEENKKLPMILINKRGDYVVM